jgi:hypothetical protein
VADADGDGDGDGDADVLADAAPAAPSRDAASATRTASIGICRRAYLIAAASRRHLTEGANGCS